MVGVGDCALEVDVGVGEVVIGAKEEHAKDGVDGRMIDVLDEEGVQHNIVNALPPNEAPMGDIKDVGEVGGDVQGQAEGLCKCEDVAVRLWVGTENAVSGGVIDGGLEVTKDCEVVIGVLCC